MRLRFSFSQQEITSHSKKIHYTGIKRDVKKLPLIKRTIIDQPFLNSDIITVEKLVQVLRIQHHNVLTTI